MKKNFLKIAALLIAAMLLVVSCTQEVKAPENDGLVKASLSVGFDRDIRIEDFDGTGITYVYSVTPNWDKLTNGVEPYGKKTDEVIGEVSISQAVTNQSIGYLTPGLWTVSVKGYKNYDRVNKTGTLVLQGTTNVYFNGTNGSATVLVAPVTSGSATVSISLQMQDLGEGNNKIKLEFIDIAGNTEKTVELTSTEKVNGMVNGEAAYNYVNSNVGIKSGYYTVKVTVPGYDKGGYVRTFLAIDGSTISISGSVYPSEFINSSMDIITISLANAQLSNDNPVRNNEAGTYSIKFTLDDSSNRYLTQDQINALKAKSDVQSVTVEKTYDWYLNSVKVDTTTSNECTITGINPGNPSVSCVINYLVTIKYTNNSTESKKFIGHANSSEFTLE